MTFLPSPYLVQSILLIVTVIPFHTTLVGLPLTISADKFPDKSTFGKIAAFPVGANTVILVEAVELVWSAIKNLGRVGYTTGLEFSVKVPYASKPLSV